MGKFIFNKYYKECQSELKKDDVTHFTKNDKVKFKKALCFFIIYIVYMQHAFRLDH